ncbi:HVO_2922 family protein [Haloarcula amylolytica]|jgi:amphi-Trp domain-containing protein|uniref:HVO_2922 family protein n=1 Tax=Haloarcula amylolytica TaxID=396317 RepID=UPI003C7781D8
MTDETVHESQETRSRRGIASYFRRLANRLSRGEPAPADEEQTVTVDPPAESDFEVEVEREDGTVSLEIDMQWEEAEGEVETDVVASKATFEVYEDSAEQYRWRLVHDNGNIIADSGEGYASKQKAKQGLQSVKNNAPGAYVVDESTDDEAPDDEGGSKATFELFKDSEDKARWRLRHDNGEIIADCGQGYASKQKAKQGLQSVKTNARGAPVEEGE